MKVNGILKHKGIPTASNRILVNDAAAASFQATAGADRVTTLVVDVAATADATSITVRVQDHLGRSSDVL
jgi:hypothetical protein